MCLMMQTIIPMEKHTIESLDADISAENEANDVLHAKCGHLLGAESHIVTRASNTPNVFEGEDGHNLYQDTQENVIDTNKEVFVIQGERGTLRESTIFANVQFGEAKLQVEILGGNLLYNFEINSISSYRVQICQIQIG